MSVRATTLASRGEDILAGQREYLFPCVRPYYRDPLVLAEAHGVRVVDAEGREYLDIFAGILTTSVGHCHPVVNARVQDQMERLGHTSPLYVTENQVDVARRLADISPGALRRSLFTNSGSEAVETAVVLAQLHTGRSEIIALRHAYSGRGVLTSNLTGHASWRQRASSIAGILHARSPYTYRFPIADATDEDVVDFLVQDLVEIIETTTNGRPAALIAETIQGVGGFIVPPAGYFGKVAEVIRSYGGLLIIDEVQAGFGRTGDKWFGIEHWGVDPDIMVMAKGIANGYPVGATITTDEIAASWTPKHLSTFGGNPISMAAAQATLDVMIANDVPTRAAERGAQLRAGFEALASQYDWIGEVRGMGLMQALELVDDSAGKKPSPRRATALLEACRDEGVLVGVGGLNGHVIRVGPTLLVTEEEIDEALERFGRACRTVNTR